MIKDLKELREELEKLTDELRKRIKVDEHGIARYSEGSIDPMDKIKDVLIDFFVGEQLSEAEYWLDQVRREVRRLVRNLDLRGFTYPREFNSFISDPRAHLRKKLFNYIDDLACGRIDVEELLRKAAAALRTSLRTNLRSAYQIWCVAAIINELHEKLSYVLEFPEHRFLNFDRSGKQRLGIIPPNLVLIRYSKGYLSFFHEAPRPISWEDTPDLKRVWSLYTALRPDMLVYSGKVMNIVNIPNDPPIKRPNVLIEIKETPDWYNRVRDLKGYLRKPLTAEEWRSKWKEGLHISLASIANVLNVKRSEVKRRVEEGASLRVREYKLLHLYVSTYSPDKAVLISKHPLPDDIRDDIESRNVLVLDDVGFDKRKLAPLVEILDSIATFGDCRSVSVSLRVETLKKVMRMCAKIGLESESPEMCIESIIERLSRGHGS